MLLLHLVRRFLLQSQSENAREMSRQRTPLNVPRHDIDVVLILPPKSHVLDHHAVHVMTLPLPLPLNHRERRTGTERGREIRREQEREKKSPGLSSMSEWTRRTLAAKRDTKSDAGHKQGRTTGSHRASRVRSRNFSASLEREGNNQRTDCP
jgi:hypothetical protein